jgi:hypothetical protein
MYKWLLIAGFGTSVYALHAQQLPMGQPDIALRPLSNPALVETKVYHEQAIGLKGFVAELAARSNRITVDGGPSTYYFRGEYAQALNSQVFFQGGVLATKFDTDPLATTRVLARGALAIKMDNDSEKHFLSAGFSIGWQQYHLIGLDKLRPLFPTDPLLDDGNRNRSFAMLGTGILYRRPAPWLGFRATGNNHGSIEAGVALPQIGIRKFSRANDAHPTPFMHVNAHLNVVAQTGNCVWDALFLAQQAPNTPIGYEILLRCRLLNPRENEKEWLRFGLGLAPANLWQIEMGCPIISKRENDSTFKPDVFLSISYAYSLKQYATFFSQTGGINLLFRW